MNKFFVTRFLILLLLVTVVSRVAEVDAKTCQEILDPKSCTLEACRKTCFEKHQSNGGQCVENGGDPLNPTYECLCVYEC
ncbi:hypothetical protein PTKIN_Ptkin09bG0034000 [Pterospermum kingtungense]